MPRFKDKVCPPGSDLHAAQEEILAAIQERGFQRFQEYLAARTVKGGGTWTLREMAEDLGLSCTAFIRFHSRWVEENAPT
jgi:hypothetical protein